MREQAGWDEHAAFMTELVSEGLVILGGPIGDGARVLLIVEADSAAAIHSRFAADPWTPAELLPIVSIEPWTVMLRGEPRH